ncbi:MAG: AAA family ATPase, partial [Bacteroidales bacterium]|nr:AAA family ATPase [Bacteroidales bacterium]
MTATISTKMTYSTPVEFITRIFIGEYVGRAKAALMKEYLAKNTECPDQEITDELTVRMKALEALLHDDLWQNYVLDISTLVHEPDEVPLIFRRGQGFFYRGNLYLISGYAGAMKSFLALSIAASASNKGASADRTLNFYSTAGPLKVLMFDTELAKNTIKKRIKALMTMVPEIDLHL